MTGKCGARFAFRERVTYISAISFLDPEQDCAPDACIGLLEPSRNLGIEVEIHGVPSLKSPIFWRWRKPMTSGPVPSKIWPVLGDHDQYWQDPQSPALNRVRNSRAPNSSAFALGQSSRWTDLNHYLRPALGERNSNLRRNNPQASEQNKVDDTCITTIRMDRQSRFATAIFKLSSIRMPMICTIRP